MVPGHKMSEHGGHHLGNIYLEFEVSHHRGYHAVKGVADTLFFYLGAVIVLVSLVKGSFALLELKVDF